MTSFLSFTKVEESMEDLKVNDLEKYVRLKLGQKVFPTPSIKQCLVKRKEGEEQNPYCQCKNCTYNKWYYTWEYEGHLRLDFDAGQFTKSNFKILQLFDDLFQEVKVVIHTHKNSVQAYFVHLEDYQKYDYWEEGYLDMMILGMIPYIESMDLTDLTTVEIMKTVIERVEKIKQHCLCPTNCGYQLSPLCDNCVIRENQMLPSIFNFKVNERAFFSSHFPKTTQKLSIKGDENDSMIIDCEKNFSEEERTVIREYEINQIEELMVHKRIHFSDKIQCLKHHKYARETYEMNGYEVVNDLSTVHFGKYMFCILVLHDGRIKYCCSLGEKKIKE